MSNLSLRNMIRVSLIAVIFFNTLTSSTAFAQAKQESISVMDPNTGGVEQVISIPQVEQLSHTKAETIESQQTTDTESKTSTIFIENVGQFDPRARFQAQGNGATIYFADDAIWFTLLEPFAENPIEKHHKEQTKESKKENQKHRKGVNLKVNLVGSNPHPNIESFNRATTSFSYFTGSDQNDWHSDVPAWGGIRYVDIYPGMDLEITSEGDHLIWEFLVTNSSRFYDKNNQVSQQGIRIKVAGHQKLQVQNDGFDITTDVGTLTLPVIRLDGEERTPQIDKNGEIIVPLPNQTSLSPDIFKSVNYIIPKETRQNEFASSQLSSLTQPVNNMPLSSPEDLLLYSTFFGGSVQDIGQKLVVGQNQMVYVAGYSYSPDFPVTPGAYDTDNLNHDGFVAKIDITNSQIVYATHLGGWADPQDLAVDSNGNVYVTGYTQDLNFPTTLGVFGSTREYGTTGFVSKLSASGNQLLYSTFLGGSTSCCNDTTTYPYAIAVDDNGFVYIAGSTLDDVSFAQTTVGYDLTHNGDWDAFITKINPTFTQQVYFTYLGGIGDDFNYTRSLLLDESGSVYIAGDTVSSDFPTTPGAYNSSSPSSFVLKLNPSGESLDFSTFLGGWPGDITMDNNGSLYIALNDVIASSMPITYVIDQDTRPFGTLVVKLNSTGSALEFSTHLTDGGDITGISLDSQGYIYVLGNTVEYDVQTSPASYSPLGGYNPDCQTTITYTCYDIFIQKLTPSGDQLVYGSYFGGSSVDGSRNVVADDNGNILFLADTSSADFPTTPDAIDNTLGSNNWSQGDVAIVKMSTNIPIYDCSGTALSSIGQSVLSVVSEGGDQNYCLNTFDKFTFIEDEIAGEAAYEEFAELARQANYEVDFTTMIWNKRAGEIFLAGVKDLYEKVNANPANYSQTVRVRILLGMEHYLGGDQRHNVLESLSDMGVPLEPANLPWKVEVATYRNSPRFLEYDPPNIHSHVKMLIVDGNNAIVSGYNVQDLYIDSAVTDLGIKISGPIVQDSLKVFDELWYEARGLRCKIGINCTYTIESLGQIPHALEIYSIQPDYINATNIFSLFRNHDTEKLADTVISDAMSASSTRINLLQHSFFENYPPRDYCINDICFFENWEPDSWPARGEKGPFPYAQAVIEAAQNDVEIRMLLSASIDIKNWNTKSLENIRKQILALPNGAAIFDNIKVRFSKNTLHAKAVSIDGKFIIVGSQNFDFSAFGDDPDNLMDLSEYSYGIDNETIAGEFDTKFDDLWADAREYKIVEQSIQQAIDQASPDAVIFIPSGTYQESIIIDKPLVLIGENENQTIIQPTGSQPGIQVRSSNTEISNLRITGGEGYGMELIDSSPNSLKDIQINRVVLENNVQGGVLVQGLIPGSPMNYSIENNTFIGGNSGVSIDMIGAQVDTSFIRNNIFVGQAVAPIDILSSDDSHVEYSYNLFDNCGAGTCVANWKLGNMSTSSSAHDNLFDLDPLLSNPENGIYQLSAGSPAIDAGNPDIVFEFDRDGDNDGTIRTDIGVFEYIPPANIAPVVNAGNDQTIYLGGIVTVNSTYIDADNAEGHSAKIDWGDGVVEDTLVNVTGSGTGNVDGQHIYVDIGTYAVEICVTDFKGSMGCDTLNVDVTPPIGLTEIKIGETFILPYDDYGNSSIMIAQHTTLSQEATLQSLSFYVTQAAGNLRLGIYDDANGNPDTLVAKTDEFTPVVGWNTQSVQTPALLPPGSYWLALLPESDDLHFRYGWPGPGQETGRYYSYPYGEMPLTYSSSPASGEFQFSFYATFTVAAEPGTVYVGEVNVLHADAGESSNLLIAQQTQLTHTATVQSLSFYVTNAVGKLRLGIYDDGWDGPGALMAQTDEFTPVVGWNTVSVQSPTLLPAGTYWLAFLPESDDLWFKYEWVPGLYTGRIYGYPFGEMPSMVTDQPIGVEYRYSFYATFIEDDSVYTPATALLDDFNRADGAIGSSWSGETSEVGIASNQLTVNSFDTTISWNNEPFGADQEAFITFSQLNTSTYNDQGLALKMQSNGTLEDGALVVSYDGGGEHLHVYTFDDTQGWVQHGNDIYVTFTNGDLLGVRARADGIVEVYRNEDLVAVRNITSWPYYAQGGYIGLSFYSAEGAVVDDFGGGTLAGGEMMMASTFSTFEPGPQPEGSIEFSVMSSPFDPATDLDRALLQIASTVSGQTAYVMIAKESAGEIVLDRSHSHRTLKDGDLRVLFDMAGQRIQILKYDSQKGWAQVNKDISVRFNVGDRFRLFLRADGTLEIYRNGKLLAKRDVTP